ncbi:RNA polymerase subunit sigma-70 [Nonomuraea fastidiosa]|uniref:RNA polymerase subunit sigma-70 n=1 Tax=Nonomuraea fastidiosa TaxID=46173 RepID=UPI0036723856
MREATDRPHTTTEAELLDAARAGDGDAFGDLVGPLRGELRAYCYRMLGSVHDAEDVVQETLDRAWRGLGRVEHRGSFRPWLYRIATNRSLTLIERRGRRELPADLRPDGPSAGDVAWLEPYPDRLMGWVDRLGPEARTLQRESMELAFVAMLQHLTAVQRAALLLRDVLGYSAGEAAEVLDTGRPAVNSALQRARKVLAARRPEESQQQALAALGEAGRRDVAQRYAEAWESGDADAILALLTEDARISMPPLTELYRGHAEIRIFLSEVLGQRWRVLPTEANGQLAFGTYAWDGRSAYQPAGLDLITVRGSRIGEVVSFLTADFTSFGLPARLPEGYARTRHAFAIV